MESDNKVQELIAAFVRLRQSGTDRDSAWAKIEADAQLLSQREMGQLIAMLRSWEAKEGASYGPKPAPPESPVQPVAVDPETIKRKGIRRIGSKAPPAGQSGTECPACHKINPPEEMYCYSCGTLLVNVVGTRQIVTNPLDGTSDPSYFDDTMVLYFVVRGANHAIRVEPRPEEMVIGRTSADSVVLPDIDLAPYKADELGMSRLHAGLRRQGNTLLLADMGSVNHTYLNGQRMHPHEVRVLSDGDEIRFGQLPVQVFFRKP